ncbi:MAG: hypothetical protein KAX09_10765 [Candidatus Heimdallarchaeota archaeon]|nr:hypothetical protein [Candidatus Heimdallarchaeota archaeon]MCK4291453.1 hypothetical protein [Candidatus Heimdallarchaeota archaeon]
MANFIEKNYRLLSIIGFILIVFIITGGLIFGPFNEILPDSLREKLGYSTTSSNWDEDMEVRLIIDFSGFRENINQTILIEANHTASAYTIMLLANLSVEVRIFPSGIFVEAIAGIEQSVDNYWKYYVDGSAGSIASDKFDLRENNAQEISWIYKSFS